ncbi:MAG TPA: transglutaminaseTgpA domain-containing protein [Gaiellaceae bacterium]|nr:transglutaminaseTgpA domain-containing protein [Gaiellaceae bacterium]
MRESLRTLAVSLVPAVVVGVVWLRFEHPRDQLGRAIGLVVLALAVAAVRPPLARVAAVVVGVGIAVRLAFGLSLLDARPHDAHRDFFGPLGSRFSNGFLDFYDVHLPFDPRLHPDMRSVVLFAIFAFALLVALLVAARRPLAALLALLAGAGWPATLLGPSRALVAGAAILLAGLALLAGLTPRRLPRGTVAAAAALALVALGLSSSPAVAKKGVVAWQTWRPVSASAPPVSVSFVWNAQYGGIRFPRRKTTVLEVETSVRRSLFWRAALLDDFRQGRWRTGLPRPADFLEPPAALRPSHQTKQVITVKALADTRLVGGSTPIRFDAGGAELSRPEPGMALLPSGLTRDFRYTAWSYAPQPSAAALRRSPARYPSVLAGDGLVDVSVGVTMPLFGTPERAGVARQVVAANPQLDPYRPLQRLAEEVGGGAHTPYDAAVALEQWFRSTGGFRYTNRPPRTTGRPLVDFVARTRAGYCQHFAGAMALMLRYLGIPARVAVGFSSGTYDDGKGAWIVTDHDAHAWVEAWFAGYGWLPFDPTPNAGRPEQGSLNAGYSSASPGFGTPTPGSPSVRTPPDAQANHRHGEQGTGVRGAARLPGASAGPRSHALRNGILFVLALLLGGGVGGIALTKLALRLVRRLDRDPRRVAAGCRRELAAFLVDQRIEAARSSTLHELGALLRHELAVDADRFVAAATAARFGRAEGAPAAARAARRELRALLRDVRRRLSGRERLRGLLSLRSLGVSP